MKSFATMLVVLVVASGLPRPAHAQNIKTYTSKAAFLADTAADSATDPLKNVGRVVDVDVNPLGTHTIGSLTFGLTVGSDNISVGGGTVVEDWYPFPPGIEEMALGFERMQVSTAAPVFSFGFDFIEPGPATVQPWGGVPVESDYEILLFDGPALVGQAVFPGAATPNDVVSFLGVWSDRPFDRVVINDISGNDDDEYFGEFYTGTTPFGCTLSIDVSYASGTFTMDFELGSATAATWNAWFTYGASSLVSLWSVAIPAIAPPVKFPVAFALPPLHGVGVLTTVTVPGQGIVCSAFKTVAATP